MIKQLLCLFLFLMIYSGASGQSLEGLYSGSYIYSEDNAVTADTFPVIMRFSDITYHLYHNQSDLCKPFGRYHVSGSQVVIDELFEGCSGSGINATKNPYGMFSFVTIGSSLDMTATNGDTIKTLELIDVTNDKDILVWIENHGMPSHVSQVEVPVYLRNNNDTLRGFQIWVILNRPDLLQFNMTYDITNTIIEGWGGVSIVTIGGQGVELLISGVASPTQPSVPPYSDNPDGDLPLIKLGLDVLSVPDFVTDRTVLFQIHDDNLDNINFSDPHGNSIGISFNEVYDTLWYNCTQYLPPPDDNVCANWEQAAGPPADSFVVDTTLSPYLDSTKVFIGNGSFSLPLCGNMNGFGTQVDISDLLYLVDYFFLTPNGPAPYFNSVADITGDGSLNISDLLMMVDYFFLVPPPPTLCQ